MVANVPGQWLLTVKVYLQASILICPKILLELKLQNLSREQLTAALPPASVNGSCCLSSKLSFEGGSDHFWCQETLLRVTVQPVTLYSPLRRGTPVNRICGEGEPL